MKKSPRLAVDAWQYTSFVVQLLPEAYRRCWCSATAIRRVLGWYSSRKQRNCLWADRLFTQSLWWFVNVATIIATIATCKK
jgi:hypothetical protein